MEEVEKIVGKNSIDVVYDGVGIKTFKGSIETLKVRGMMVAFGNASGYVDTLDIKNDINAKISLSVELDVTSLTRFAGYGPLL